MSLPCRLEGREQHGLPATEFRDDRGQWDSRPGGFRVAWRALRCHALWMRPVDFYHRRARAKPASAEARPGAMDRSNCPAQRAAAAIATGAQGQQRMAAAGVLERWLNLAEGFSAAKSVQIREPLRQRHLHALGFEVDRAQIALRKGNQDFAALARAPPAAPPARPCGPHLQSRPQPAARAGHVHQRAADQVADVGFVLGKRRRAQRAEWRRSARPAFRRR
jgi:hypothetical protein